MLVVLEEVPQLLAGILLLLASFGVLALDFHGRLHRALALFLFLWGSRHTFGALNDTPALADVAAAMLAHLSVASAFAAVHLAARYHEVRTGRRAGRALGWALLACVVGLNGAALLDLPTFGARTLVRTVVNEVLSGVALLLALDASRARLPGARRALGLAAIGFVLDPLFRAVDDLHEATFVHGWSAYVAAGDLREAVLVGVTVASILFSLLAGLLLPFVLARPRWDLPARLAAALVALTVLVSAALAFGDASGALYNALEGMWVLALPFLLSYAVLRHRLFDLDVKVRWTISRGSVATVFLAAFLVVGQVAQAFLDTRLGWAAGGLAAGVLVLALHPIQRAAERVAEAAMPGVRPIAQLDAAERVALYRAQVEEAWADGALDATEQRMLERLRLRLGLGAEEARAIEMEAASPEAARRPPAGPPRGRQRIGSLLPPTGEAGRRKGEMHPDPRHAIGAPPSAQGPVGDRTRDQDPRRGR